MLLFYSFEQRRSMGKNAGFEIKEAIPKEMLLAVV